MRAARFALLMVCLFAVPTWGQQAEVPDSATTPSPAVKDPQAVSVVTQAINAAGGSAAIAAISDYTASGTITYHLSKDVQGTVTLRASGLGKFRLDANLPSGIHSEVVNGLITTKDNAESAKPALYQAPTSPGRLALPYLQLGPALTSSGLSLSYKGLVQIDGVSVHDVQIEQIFPNSDPTGLLKEYHTVEYFIDASTFQVIMMQDIVVKHLVRQIRYSNFKVVSGVLVPFAISEDLIGQPAWSMTLDQFGVNSGLQDSDFQL